MGIIKCYFMPYFYTLRKVSNDIVTIDKPLNSMGLAALNIIRIKYFFDFIGKFVQFTS